MNIEREIFEVCEKVVENESSFEVDCSHISCEICPLSSVNRKGGMGCIVDDKETVRIAKEYIDKNKGYYKVKEIIKNIDMFEIGTRFSLFGRDILSIGENETIILEENMNNELDLNLVLEIERPKKERIVTFEELKVGDIFVLRKEGRNSYFIRKVVSRVNKDVLVVQLEVSINALGSDNMDRYDILPKNKVVGWDIVLIEE